MKTSLALSWRLLRGGGRRGLLGSSLTLAAVAVSTTLLLFTVAANFAFQGRAEREAWRNPVKSAKPVAVEAMRRDYAAGRPITVIDLAALDGRTAPPPPGLRTFPRPGQVWLSPALADLASSLPADQLAARYGKPAGVLGEQALIHPGELVAVVGRAPGDPAMTAARSRDMRTAVPPTPIADFTGERTNDAIAYQALALIASVLMLVPLLVFGGAAARLTVARRDQRLAALRLVGATPGQVVGMTAAEAVIVAFAGALLGFALYALVMPLLAGIPIAGGGWFVADLWPGLLTVAAVLVAVPLLVGVSAVAGLRRVVVSPLGVAKRETPPGMRFVRMIVLLVVLAAVPVVVPNAGVGVVAVMIGLAFLAVNLAGPWVVGMIGRITAGAARRPARLLAARRLIDDPRAGWRTVSGVAMTGFVAGFIGLLSPGAFATDGAADELRLTAPASAVAQVERRLDEAGIGAQVSHKDGLVTIAVKKTDDATLDRARTALEGVSPGHGASTRAEEDKAQLVILDDIRVGVITVLAVSFLVAIASSAITAASSILDRRQTYALLRLAGTPLEVLDKARRAETLIPLTVMGGGTILAGAFCALPFASGSMSSTGAITLAVCVGLGFGGVIAAGALSRPLLRSVTADPAPRPD